MTNENDISRFLAKEQNLQDHITRKLWGPGVKFEQLSAFGQHTVEKLARDSKLIDEDDPMLREAKADNIRLAYELEASKKRESALLQENRDLWEENEELRIELYDAQKDDSRRRTRSREVSDTIEPDSDIAS